MAFSYRYLWRTVLTLGAASLLAGPAALALDRTNFPIRVFIEPLVRDYQGQQKPSQPLPEETVRSLRQGFLDWVRVLLFAPGKSTAENYTVILHRQGEEQQARLLLNAGVFTFVERRDQADLTVEAFDRPRTLDADGITGRFLKSGAERVGKIEIVFRGSLGEYPDEFALRSVVMHEAGHALGLAHLSEQKCNLMAPKDFTCNVPFPVDCRAGAGETRCVGVSTEQVHFVQSARAAAPGAGPRSPMADIRDYRQGVVRRIRDGLVAATVKVPGRVVLKLGSTGGVEEAAVESSFGNAETDEKILEGIRGLAPFGALPATWKGPTVRFSFTLDGPTEAVDP